MHGRKLLSALALTAFVSGMSLAVPAIPAAFAAHTDVSCRVVSGAATVTPGLQAAPGPQTLSFDSLAASKCGAANPGLSLAISGSLQGDGVACPPAAGEGFRGSLEIDWSNHFGSSLESARLTATGNPDDPFAMRLRGVMAGADGGDTLDVALHLAPTAGDCGSGVTSVAIANLGPLTIGGSDLNCRVVSGAATLTPGLQTAPGPQTLSLDSLAVSKCGAANKGLTLAISGSLQSDGVSCPPAAGDNFHGSLEIDWSNHFGSSVRNAGLTATGNPDDPYEMRLHGVVAGADGGDALDVVLHLAPTAGDCGSGVTNVAITSVGRFIVGGPDLKCGVVSGAATVSPGWQTAPGPQTLSLDSFTASRCGAENHGLTLAITGSLQSDAVACPPAPGTRLHGRLEIDWSNDFGSIVGNARLEPTGNPDDPSEMRLSGVVTGAADTGDSLVALLDVTPTVGDCGSGVTNVALGGVRALTIG